MLLVVILKALGEGGELAGGGGGFKQFGRFCCGGTGIEDKREFGK